MRLWEFKRRSPKVVRSNVQVYTLNSRNTNHHNITRSIISQNPRERMFVVQISLFIVTFLSLTSRTLSLMQKPPKKSTPYTHIAPCVNMWSVTFFFLCDLLNVGACICHIAREGQVEWTTSTEVRGECIQIP